MSMVINHNVPAIRALNSLYITKDRMDKIQYQMSTGKRINVAADDPAGVSIATKMNVRIGSMKVASDNISDAKNLLGIAEGGLKGISDTLIELRKYAGQAKNDTLGVEERASIQSSMDALVSEIDDYVSQAQFNGIDLLDGSADLTMHTGPDSTDTTQITVAQDYTSNGLGVTGMLVDDSTNAQAAIEAIDTALASVDSGRTDLGAYVNRFTSKENFINTSIENLTASVSRIEDFDYAKGVAELTNLETKYQANIQALGMAVSFPQSILSLLGIA